MTLRESRKNLPIWELVFQTILLVLVFLFYALDSHGNYADSSIHTWEVVFFLNYVLAAVLINYILLPKFLYHKKYWHFSFGVLLILVLVIFIEEAVLEQIYFPATRGSRFPGIFQSLRDVLPVIIILAGFKFAWDALTKQREVEQLQSAIQESELQFLKSQINPHFLFNNLNNLYSHALEQSPRTTDIILEFSAVLRYILYECQERYVPLTREVEHLENLMNLSRLQMEGRGALKFECTEIPGS